MRDWRSILISPDTPIMDALGVIDKAAMRVALVVDGNEHLLGIVTDGDVRRGLLRRIDLSAPVREIMNASPTSARVEQSRESLLELMKSKGLLHVPLLDHGGKLVGLETIDNLLTPARKDNWVVLMAGGLGSRLSPLTNDCPKPLLKIAETPLLEIIIKSFVASGFHKFFISVNYMASMIEDYFGDGSAWGVEIQYLKEDQRLGTAGALTLLPQTPNEPFFVMNGDIMTRVNYQHLLDFHRQQHVQATMCVREYQNVVPYGVVKADQQRLVAIEEKPVQHFFINAGIYVLEPELLSLIPEETFFDMPTLFQKAMAQGEQTGAFPIYEYWLDIGRMEDFERAHRDYPGIFT